MSLIALTFVKNQKRLCDCSFRLDGRCDPFVSCFDLLPVKCIFLYTVGLRQARGQKVLLSYNDRRNQYASGVR